MTRARRFIATIAATAALAAVPTTAGAQAVEQCVDPATEPVVYVCVSHDPEYGQWVLWRIDDTKYVLSHDEDGWHLCVNPGSGNECVLP